ncbi:glutathione S-transferase [Allosediminivita pacifica]|uniref:Glutathione S-transferase n=1 Tax=Allosediminivita pacifica TaxID=1267769 RepID=A0A2T6ANT8_9RHOB|nr:glutathione S-transferase [Allosediminivita pacifica]PTX45502.1 glutathione S-transferase [Allosediminivita pacifica]GGB19968.1 glutathione S-transferase [Allosediminivita pacifica]
MKLLKAGPSPFVRKVLVTLHETGLMDQVEMVQVTASPLDPDSKLTSANPVGKVPALVRDEGPTLYDSRVICRYLDHVAGTKLYPQARIWDTLTLEATADGILEAAVLMVYEGRFRPENLRYDPWIEGQWAKVTRALAALEGRWMSHLNGPLDAGQIACACALGYLDFRHADRPWRAAHPALAEWEAGFKARDSMIATRPE